MNRHNLTQRQAKFMAEVDKNGEAWYVPSQSKMVRRMAQMGLLEITNETRFSGPRGSRERKVVPK